MGGIDWSGFELIVQMLGVADVEGLIHRLYTIKMFKPDTPPDASPEPGEDASA